MNYIVVSKAELEHYLYRTQSHNEIWYFWRKIVKKMPDEIYEAIKNKRTDLVHISKGI